MIYYKLRSRSNPELFRKADGSFNKSGKVYDTIGKLRSFLTHEIRSSKGLPTDLEVVEYEVKELSVKRLDQLITKDRLLELIDGKKR
jgi:hypothetical protein